MLAPSYDLLMDWKETHDNDAYIRRYNAEVLDWLTVDTMLNRLLPNVPSNIMAKLDVPIYESKDWHIALICYEKPSDFCHRHLVAKWLRDRGIWCEEWTKG